MATRTKIATKTAIKKAPPARKVAPAKRPAVTTPTLKPLKDTFTRASLVSHLAKQAAIDAGMVEAMLFHLESTIVASLHKKGMDELTLPGLFKVTSVKVPTTKRRFDKSPLTGVDQWFEAKLATVCVEIRALKKVKDAAVNS